MSSRGHFYKEHRRWGDLGILVEQRGSWASDVRQLHMLWGSTWCCLRLPLGDDDHFNVIVPQCFEQCFEPTWHSNPRDDYLIIMNYIIFSASLSELPAAEIWLFHRECLGCRRLRCCTYHSGEQARVAVTLETYLNLAGMLSSIPFLNWRRSPVW